MASLGAMSVDAKALLRQALGLLSSFWEPPWTLSSGNRWWRARSPSTFGKQCLE